MACVFFFISVLKNQTDLYQVPGIVPLSFFLFYILLQLVPLPPFIIKYISPGAFDIHQTACLLAGRTTSWMTISVNQKAGLSEFFRFSTYVMFYVLTIQLLAERKMLQTTVILIVIFGGLLSFSSILQFYMTKNMALWFRYVPRNSMVMGPYVNHNHYAGLMEMIFPIVLGLFLFYRPQISNTSLVRGIAEIFNQEKANIHILIGTSALLVIVSIFVSLSRGAMISTCLALIVFTYLVVKRKISRGNTLLIIGIIILTALSIGWFGWDHIFARFAKLKDAQGVIYESRLDFWKDTLSIIHHYIITGSGMGSFPHIYPLYRSFTSKHFLTHAHNDYLELLAEGGIISFFIAACFLSTLFYKTYRAFSKRRDGFSIYLYIGCITGMVSILFHSFTDFNTHIGANGLWFFFIAGIAVSAANTGIRRQSTKTRLFKVEDFHHKLSSAFIVSTAAFFLILYNFSNLLGIFYYSNIKNYNMSVNTAPGIIKKIQKVADLASIFDPFKSDYPFVKANTAWFLKDLKQARRNFVSSMLLDPLNSAHLNRFAVFLAQQGETDKARIAFDKSMVYDRSSAEYTFQYATWLLAEKDNRGAVEYMKKTLELDDKYMDRALTAMIIAGLSSSEIEEAIPDMPGPSIAFAHFLYNIGDFKGAAERALDALDLIENRKKNPAHSRIQQDGITRSYFFRIYWFFINHHDIQNAMKTMERAEKILPMDAGIKVALGNLYYRQGILYRASDKYEQALLLDPENRQAMKMLKKINQ